ncbi:MAG: arylsulfatase, partial [Verrucomicrobia bacterium]|nr:arylsulfatase [Verrucomicrobiota bacterium]
RPNIILIMLDDMGFSDIGCYGGEIDTPYIDELANGGVKFSHFYNNSRCCPTRASLLTGLQPHRTGIGWMTNPTGTIRGEDKPPAYRGYLNRKCVTLAEVLKPAGYATILAGKWHLGWGAEDRWPLQRGFEKFYGCIHGAHSFNPSGFKYVSLGNEKVTEFKSTTDRRYYTTDAFTDYAVQFIDEELSEKKRPFFLYLAYTAPHWPILAHDEEMEKYQGKYDIGWDKIREQRYQRQIELGLIDPKWKLSPRDEAVPAWDSLDEEKKALMSLRMTAYAGMIDRVDQNIGKLIGFLKEKKVYDNTLILFLSDNGACAEGGLFGSGDVIADRETSKLMVAYGQVWANASSTPFRMYKHYTHEGGAATPFFMHWPKGIRKQESWYDESAQLIDVMPTLLEVAEAKYPKTFHGNPIPNLDGLSLTPTFRGESLKRSGAMFSEHENNAFVIQDKWKLVGRGVAGDNGVIPDKWELYDLDEDRTELNNLVQTNSEKAEELARAWRIWADENQVYPKVSGGE